MGLLSGSTKDTQAARLTQATNLLDSPEAQTVAQSYRVLNTSVLPAITVQVCPSSACVWQSCADVQIVAYVLVRLMHNSVLIELAQSCTYAGVPAHNSVLNNFTKIVYVLARLLHTSVLDGFIAAC